MKHAHGITFVLILSYLGSGCLGDMERRVDRLERENIDLRADMESAWANALCSDDVRTLIDSVNQKCQQSLRDAREKEQAGFCLDTDVAMAVLVADPKHQGRFLSLMRSQRHSVVYLATGATSLPAARAEGFKKLASQRLLPTTRFLIASQSGSNPKPAIVRDSRGKVIRPPASSPADILAEGRRRVNLVADQLANLGVPRDRMLKWLFSFPVDRTEIDRQDDLPRLGEPDDLYTSVWVFRVDCQLDNNSSPAPRSDTVSN